MSIIDSTPKSSLLNETFGTFFEINIDSKCPRELFDIKFTAQ